MPVLRLKHSKDMHSTEVNGAPKKETIIGQCPHRNIGSKSIRHCAFRPTENGSVRH